MMVDLTLPFLVRARIVRDARLLDLAERGIEFFVGHQEGVMLRAHVLGIDEVEGDAVARLHRPENSPLLAGLHAQDARQEDSRRILVLGRNDNVVERCHRTLRLLWLEVGAGTVEFNRPKKPPRRAGRGASTVARPREGWDRARPRTGWRTRSR